MCQDNESAIKMENSGRASSGKRTRHINVRYFCIADRIKSKEVSVAYCPTSDIVADFFPTIAGCAFQRLCDMILNIPRSIDPASIAPALGPQECVGNGWQIKRADA